MWRIAPYGIVACGSFLNDGSVYNLYIDLDFTKITRYYHFGQHKGYLANRTIEPSGLN